MANQSHTIPVWVAILINANIVIGSAFFLGAFPISANFGYLAPFAWLACGILLLPLVLTLAKLSSYYPTAGGLYVYSKEKLGTLWGFISGWGYFIGTAAGNAVLIHEFSAQFQKIPHVATLLGNVGLQGTPFDIILVALFTVLTLKNIEFLERTQILFAILKAVPFVLVLIAAPLLFNLHTVIASPVNWSGIATTFPLVLFAYIGIEACCAVADKIEDGKRNAAKVILVSFGLIIGIYSITQFLLLSVHGSSQPEPFFAIIPMLTANPTVIAWGNALIYVTILSSFLAGFYGMFYYNNWNLYAIGKEGNLPFSKAITALNVNSSPTVCIVIQSLLVLIFLIMAQHGHSVVTMSDFGATIAYLLSTLALLRIERSLLAVLSLISCSFILVLSTQSLIYSGWYIPFGIVLFAGIALYIVADRKK